MQTTTLAWDSFETHPSAAEAAVVSRFCLFSFSTLELACSPGTGNIAMIEQEHPDTWRWLVISPDGFIIDAGSEPTRAHAKQAVELTLHAEPAIATAIAQD